MVFGFGEPERIHNDKFLKIFLPVVDEFNRGALNEFKEQRYIIGQVSVTQCEPGQALITFAEGHGLGIELAPAFIGFEIKDNILTIIIKNNEPDGHRITLINKLRPGQITNPKKHYHFLLQPKNAPPIELMIPG